MTSNAMNRRMRTLIGASLTFSFSLLPSALAQPTDNPLANRKRDKRRDVLRKFGGNHKTERAVADGLAWLAAHQRPDGIWDRKGFDRLCPNHDRCGQTALGHISRNADVGLSALAALAFLGAGYTHEEGKYADHLTKVFSYILAQQDVDGSFSAGSGFQMYNDAIATIAMAEAYDLTQDAVFKEPLERAIKHITRSQQVGGGWDYTDDTNTGRNDTSITGWVLMALKSAHAAGVAVPVSTRFRLIEHFDNATETGGRVWYANKRRETLRPLTPGVHRPYQRRYGPAMVATGLFSRSAFGFKLDSAAAERQIELLLRELPSLDRLREQNSPGLHNEYYWYYGTLALFNVGGERWERWNRALRRTVMEYQERPVRKNGQRRHSYGSWPAFGRNWGKWGRTGGRIYATAINTLTLEIYYRYVPAYLSPRGIIGPSDLRRSVTHAPPHEHDSILKTALRLHPDTGEPVLLDLLRSSNRNVSLNAAIALANLGSPMARARLEAKREFADPSTRRRIADAINKITTTSPEQTYGTITELNSQARMFLFETAGQPLYYGQKVRIVRDDREIGTAKINRRFTSYQAAAARIETSLTPIKEGDVVMTLKTEG